MIWRNSSSFISLFSWKECSIHRICVFICSRYDFKCLILRILTTGRLFIFMYMCQNTHYFHRLSLLISTTGAPTQHSHSANPSCSCSHIFIKKHTRRKIDMGQHHQWVIWQWLQRASSSMRHYSKQYFCRHVFHSNAKISGLIRRIFSSKFIPICRCYF